MNYETYDYSESGGRIRRCGSAHRLDATIYIEFVIATVSFARGKKAGKPAITAAEDWIRERGYKKIIITGRVEAVGFYEKLGYTADDSVDVHAMFPSPKKKPDSEDQPQKRPHPAFVTVYTEKILN
ncbi:MAG: GNAT family N-acetyltransferase [Eubacteriales bacterium]